ncbi:gluconate 2-dehydrogenase subunit 3 family protein [Roseomonas sp. SSH11]|uniref:Gluconate 2-dehydrogenase subunit 3 family protein n=1 Tax=Pararoseomonas baculiformis TaxID=2820812 RepID=A0ABS4AKM6_9PROT|nr:gluconate 2-dehydrogenase subunit 3 family protein [Pararoseomonas baculiformis]MBP0447556.1 gluconate 2-dehydrogenase subunit 3 family protein [Pararoseomonas baculiformis]
MTEAFSRRGLLLTGGSAAAVPARPASAQHGAQAGHGTALPALGTVAGSAAAEPWLFFTEDEASLVSAAVDRLIPPDTEFTGAVGAGVPTYIDRQLAGAYGSGARLYREGPWREGLPQQGYQLPHTPAELYRAGLAAFAADARRGYGRRFEELAPRLQDEALRRLEVGEAGFDELPSAVFFETLLANTIEGFFADPIYGGNRDMVGWRMVGFPGGYAGYTELVGRHGLRFDRPPNGIAQNLLQHAAGHGHGAHGGRGAPRERN